MQSRRLFSSAFNPSRAFIRLSIQSKRTFYRSPVMSSDQPSQDSTSTSSTSTSTSKPEKILALPSVNDSPTTELDVSSGQGTAKLDHLGPMVVNTDGTLSRITNWEAMTEMEQKNTLRIISKRNKDRLAALKAAGVEASG